jgi:hypothetical protein
MTRNKIVYISLVQFLDTMNLENSQGINLVAGHGFWE